jgi:phosphate transport system permease protein
MTDATMMDVVPTRRIDFDSEAARNRVKRRYRAEARFRAYGIAALVVTTLFLVALLGDIVVKGLPAFWQHSLTLDVAVTAADVDPQATGRPEVLRAGDYTAIVRRTLTERFPEARSRQDRKLLFGLLSSGATDVLRDRVVADPSLVGRTVRVPVLLSDDVDLYFKGASTRIVDRGGRGTLTASAQTGEITVSSSANDFADELVAIKKSVKVRADALSAEADRLAAVVHDMAVGIETAEKVLAAARSAGDATAVERAEKDVANRRVDLGAMQAKVTENRDAARELARRFDAPKTPEALDASLPSLLVAMNGGLVKITELGDLSFKGRVLLPLKSTADAAAGTWKLVTYRTPESDRRVGDQEIAWLEALRGDGAVTNAFNTAFFTSGDSGEAELAGIRGALVGTALTLLVTLAICLPLGVAAAIYLEEFAPKNRVTDLIEVNINNLAAVPSIVFGLLGLAVFLNFFELPRSAPVVGGLVLALLVMPTIIIASRAALKAVPPSIKEAALGVGASHQQAIFHHVLPLALPGIMTGTIIGMAHALGETAPLLMIGMVAFIVDVPGSITEAATVLPVQIYLWSDLPEVAFQSKTAAAIVVLLGFLFVMNGTAIWLRKKFERRW